MNKRNGTKITELLKAEYPDAICSLEYEKDYELLISTRLAAQCTDARVNMVTPALFARYTSPQAFAEADVHELEGYIESCGLYKTKAADIIEMCRRLVEVYGGKVPDNMDDLLTLRGVGRKTANLILGDVYGKPAVVTDTHCIRISNRLGLADSKDPRKVEDALREAIAPEEQNNFCHRLVMHGRAVCTARAPKCGECALNGVCEKRGI